MTDLEIQRMAWVAAILSHMEGRDRQEGTKSCLAIHSSPYQGDYLAELETGPHLLQMGGKDIVAPLKNVGLTIGVDIGMIDHERVDQLLEAPMMTEQAIGALFAEDMPTCLEYLRRISSGRNHPKSKPVVDLMLGMAGTSTDEQRSSERVENGST